MMSHLELPVGAFIAATLVLIPLPWHWRARNIPTISIIIWLFTSNIIYGVNSIIWANNVNIVVPVWCDIVTKIQIGATIALPACCLSLCMTLERIASIRQANSSALEKRRRMLIDLILCWGLPMIYMALHYIVQGHRYDIVEDLGCRPNTYNSVQSILLIWLPPLVATALTLIYASLALRHFMKRRLAFASHLQSNSALTTSRYFRLMAMAIVQMVWSSVVLATNMWFTLRPGLRPWISWQDVHFNFSYVGQFPTAFIPRTILRFTYFCWWTIPISSVLFFVFFAFGQDAVKEYKACFNWVMRVIFHRKDTDPSTSLSGSKLTLRHIQLTAKTSIAGSKRDTYQWTPTSKSTTSEYTLSLSRSDTKKTVKTVTSDAASSVYTPTTITNVANPPSPTWSDSFTVVALSPSRPVAPSSRPPPFKSNEEAV